MRTILAHKIVWPSPNPPPSPSEDNIKILEQCCFNLACLQLQYARLHSCASQPISSWWCIHLLAEPLNVRFAYHFTGKRQTNRIDKPEWYTTHMLRVIGDYAPFVTESIQPLLVRAVASELKCNKTSSRDESALLVMVDARADFIDELLQPLRVKACKDLHRILTSMSDSDALFMHTINELLSFEETLLGSEYGYPIGERRCVIDAISRETAILDKWISLDQQYVASIMKVHQDDWTMQFDFENELRPSKAAFALMQTLSTLNTRYCAIRDPSVRMRFITQIHLHYLGQFLLECRQMLQERRSRVLDSMNIYNASDKAFLADLCSALNSAIYCDTILRDWALFPQFLEIQRHIHSQIQSKPSDITHAAAEEQHVSPSSPSSLSESLLDSQSRITVKSVAASEGLFDAVADEFSACADAITRQIVGAMFRLFKVFVNKRYKPYIAKLDNITAPLEGPCSVSVLMNEVAIELSEFIRILSASMASSRFRFVWTALASNLDTFLCSQLLRTQHISSSSGEPGRGSSTHLSSIQCQQVAADVNALAILLFGDYSRKPQNLLHMSTNALSASLNRSCIPRGPQQ